MSEHELPNVTFINDVNDVSSLSNCLERLEMVSHESVHIFSSSSSFGEELAIE